MSLDRIFKRNALELARDHKKHCKSEHCGISLLLLREMAERCGVVFTEKENEEFI